MHPLDNVIWKALTSLQSHLGTINDRSGRFLPDVSVLAALAEATDDAFQQLGWLVNSGERVGLFLDEIPVLPKPWRILKSGPMLEMIYAGSSLARDGKNILEFQRLGESDVPGMLALTELTKPGPFSKRTHEMGEYWGIRENGRLVAMAGERLRMPGYTEVSAVCTQPDYLGRGYATALVSMLARRIGSRGDCPFLHVRADNDRAVGLYEHLGFEKRALMYYLVVERG